MNLDAVNADPWLHHTPIGRLHVERWRDDVVVIVDDGKSKPRNIHTLDDDGTVWDALYGKAPLEVRGLRAAYVAMAAEARRRSAERREREGREFRLSLAKLFRQHPDLIQMIRSAPK